MEAASKIACQVAEPADLFEVFYPELCLEILLGVARRRISMP